MSPGITMFLGCCSLDPPSPRNPLTGCFFIAKLVKHIVQLSHRYFFFFLLLLSFRCSYVFIASIYLFGASCQQFSAFSLQAATGRWGGWCPSISLECNRQLLTTYVVSFNILGAVKLPTVPGMFDVRIPIFCYPSLSLLTRWWDKTRNGEEPVKMTHSSSPSIFPTSPVKLETLVLFPSTPYYSFM